METSILKFRNHQLTFGKRTLVMGIVNVTPDSFSDGGKFYGADAAVAQALKLAEDGADIIDIGGESTRPYAQNVTAEDESARVLPVIEAISRQISIPISIDTTKASVARKAIEAGASIVNDIGALKLDKDLGLVVAQYDVPVILMHMQGSPRTMQVDPYYDDVIAQVHQFLKDSIQKAISYGIEKSRVIVDPGIGFGKTVQHNLILINHLDRLLDLGVPILIGTSRKFFIRQLLKDIEPLPENQKDLSPDAPIVEIGTQASVAAAALRGAHIVRVHDVKNTVATLRLIDAIKQADK